jgi:hypothetical protein
MQTCKNCSNLVKLWTSLHFCPVKNAETHFSPKHIFSKDRYHQNEMFLSSSYFGNIFAAKSVKYSKQRQVTVVSPSNKAIPKTPLCMRPVRFAPLLSHRSQRMPETRIASRTINMALKSIGSINVS